MKQQVIDKDLEKQPGSSLKEIVLYSGIGLALTAGTIYLVSKQWRKFQSDKEEQKALDPDDAASYAKQINMAFGNDGWWGTDEEALRKVLRRIPSKEFFKEVAESYKKNFGEPLTQAMQDELSSTEYDEMMLILAAKPKKKGDPPVYNHLAWAKRIRAAISVYYGIFPGTDEEAIKAVFLEIPTKLDYLKVQQEYLKEYGDSLIADLKGDLSLFDQLPLIEIMKNKPYQ
jgi:hypothetical protein